MAYRRFVDNVPMALDFELVQGVGRDLFRVMAYGLGVVGENASAQGKCREWTGEQPEMTEKRAQLKKKVERLREARLKISCS